MKKKIILGASIGNCVHVAGVAHFLNIADDEGYQPVFLGPAVTVDRLFNEIDKYRPDIIAISYRLTPENATGLLEEVDMKRQRLSYDPLWVFGGTKPVAQVARKYSMYSFISDGTDDIVDSIRFLRGETDGAVEQSYSSNLIDRIKNSYPYPLLRHHFGLPSLKDTIDGVSEIAESKVLDIISVGTDQNAQQFFFQQEKMNKEFDGAGGVPLRKEADFIALKKASQMGNYPLMRCYSGTEDVFQYAQLLHDTLDNAWTAVPLSWYNELDGRGTRTIERSIKEAQELISWHAKRGIPVEINEPHHWALRDAHDVISVAMAYISAYNAKKLGVKNYIAQYMFNVPSGISFSMDLARVLAMIELVETLADENFKIYRETRAGLPLFHSDLDVAKGQLASATFMQMCVKPHIIHVVGYCEAEHAALSKDVIASCKIVKGVIRHTLRDEFSIDKDKVIMNRKKELIDETIYLLDYIKTFFKGYDDPLANADVLAQCIKMGIIDAVHIVKNEKFRGNLYTKIIDGKCVAFDRENQKVLSEKERIELLLAKNSQVKTNINR